MEHVPEPEPRLAAFREVLEAIADMDQSERGCSRGEIVKWLKYELGEQVGRT